MHFNGSRSTSREYHCQRSFCSHGLLDLWISVDASRVCDKLTIAVEMLYLYHCRDIVDAALRIKLYKSFLWQMNCKNRRKWYYWSPINESSEKGFYGLSYCDWHWVRKRTENVKFEQWFVKSFSNYEGDICHRAAIRMLISKADAFVSAARHLP